MLMMLIDAWRTNARVTSLLVESLPRPLWESPIPGIPRRTVRGIAGHLHNSRASWTRTLGREHGITAPALVNVHRVTQRELIAALRRSADGIEAVLQLGIDAGGVVPPSKGYVWRNLPLDVGHVLAYFVAHEGHHRGQLVMAARQLGERLPSDVVNGLWQWTTINRQLALTSRPSAASARRVPSSRPRGG
jgi:uncharacterized damage-inducible protein DinB